MSGRARHPEPASALPEQRAAIESAVAAGREVSGDALHLAARVSREPNETILKLKPRIFG